jgi:2-(1,2-epoxy-1,2-dihydrophenyl)acetyl-CoA isomerase
MARQCEIEFCKLGHSTDRQQRRPSVSMQNRFLQMEIAVDAVVVERRGSVALVRLNQPETMNALSPAIKQGLSTHVPALLADTTVRCLVITGTGRAFCAGGDLRNMAERRAPQMVARMEQSHAWSGAMVTARKPIIAAVNGAAAGAGFSLAMLCDLVLVSDEASFRAGFPNIGAAPDLGLAFTLPRVIGLQKAKHLLLTNRKVGAEEAVELGLALRRVAPAALIDEAMALAAEIAAGPALSLGLTKMLLNEAMSPAFPAFLEKEAFAQAVAFGGDEFDEGVKAFLEKRKPNFTAV